MLPEGGNMEEKVSSNRKERMSLKKENNKDQTVHLRIVGRIPKEKGKPFMLQHWKNFGLKRKM